MTKIISALLKAQKEMGNAVKAPGIGHFADPAHTDRVDKIFAAAFQPSGHHVAAHCCGLVREQVVDIAR